MQSSPPNFKEAIVLFNQRQFFECHEVLEDLWRPLPPGPEKQFLQGLLQVGVGFHHLLNHNYRGAKNLLQAGLEKLEVVQTNSHSYCPPIVLEPLLKASQQALCTVLKLGTERIQEFPDSLIPTIKPSQSD